MINYNIDRESGITRAIFTVNNTVLFGKYYSEKTYVGISKCHFLDEFNSKKGMTIAKKRAVKQYYKDLIRSIRQENLDLNKRLQTNAELLHKYIVKVIDFESELLELTRQ